VSIKIQFLVFTTYALPEGDQVRSRTSSILNPIVYSINIYANMGAYTIAGRKVAAEYVSDDFTLI
jgi:hypothetical protein